MAVPPQTLRLLRRLANHVGEATDDTVRAITGQWLASWERLEPAWQAAISAVLAEYAASGVWPAAWQVARIEAIARAQQPTEKAMSQLVVSAAVRTRDAARAVNAMTTVAQPWIIASQHPSIQRDDLLAPPSLGVLADRLARIDDLHSTIAADSKGRLRELFRRPPQGGQLDTALLAGIRGLFEAPLTRAVTVARTELVDTCRTAARLVDEANPAIVSGWCWLCQCDRRSCTACWAMHGTRHPLDESGPAGHPGCRCQRLPLVGDNTLPTAERRFRRLPRRDQLAILGRGRYDLFHAGRINWADLAVRRSNPGWRDSYVPRPVTDLTALADTRP